jgi:hypothetical protein
LEAIDRLKTAGSPVAIGMLFEPMNINGRLSPESERKILQKFLEDCCGSRSATVSSKGRGGTLGLTRIPWRLRGKLANDLGVARR